MIKMNFLLFMAKKKHICLCGYYVVSSENWAIIFRAVDGNKGILTNSTEFSMAKAIELIMQTNGA